MYGFEYHRDKRHLTQVELAKQAGLALVTIVKLEREIPESTPSGTIFALASALQISMAETIRIYPNNALALGDHPVVFSTSGHAGNYLNRYREEKNLTFKELAELIGNSSREAGRIACARPAPLTKHVKALATHEGISVDEFEAQYGDKAWTGTKLSA